MLFVAKVIQLAEIGWPTLRYCTVRPSGLHPPRRRKNTSHRDVRHVEIPRHPDRGCNSNSPKHSIQKFITYSTTGYGKSLLTGAQNESSRELDDAKVRPKGGQRRKESKAYPSFKQRTREVIRKAPGRHTLSIPGSSSTRSWNSRRAGAAVRVPVGA